MPRGLGATGAPRAVDCLLPVMAACLLQAPLLTRRTELIMSSIVSEQEMRSAPPSSCSVRTLLLLLRFRCTRGMWGYAHREAISRDAAEIRLSTCPMCHRRDDRRSGGQMSSTAQVPSGAVGLWGFGTHVHQNPCNFLLCPENSARG